jgi:hypothetical protein
MCSTDALLHSRTQIQDALESRITDYGPQDELLRPQADYAKKYSHSKKPRQMRTLPVRLGNRQARLRELLDAALNTYCHVQIFTTLLSSETSEPGPIIAQREPAPFQPNPPKPIAFRKWQLWPTRK